MSFIETIRSKPDHIKSRYALLGAFIVTLSIAGVWFSVLPARFALIEGHLKEGTIPKATELTASIENSFESIVETSPEPVEEEVKADMAPSGALGALSLPNTDSSGGVSGGISGVSTSGVPLEPKETATSSSRVPTTTSTPSGYILIGTTTKKTQ